MNKRNSRRLLLKGAGAVTGSLIPGLSQHGFSSLLAAEGEEESATAEPAQAKYGIEGYVAPEINLDYWVDGNGESSSFSIEESRGKWVFLKFFQNWCPGCHSSGFPTLKAVCDNFYGHEKVAIAAVQTVFEGYGTNTRDKVRELQLRYEIPAVMGHDPGDRDAHIPSLTMINYRTGGTPWLVLISPDGNVVFNNFHVNREKLVEFLKEQVA